MGSLEENYNIRPMEIIGINKSTVYMSTPFHNEYHNSQQKRRNVDTLNMEYGLITNLMQLNIYLCTFSSTCFGLMRPSSGAMDVTISLHKQHMVSCKQV